MKRYKLPRGFWTRFAQDSADRGIFKPNDPDDETATLEQVRSLLSDAEFYSDRWGPSEIWPGLKHSARTTAEKCRKFLEQCAA